MNAVLEKPVAQAKTKSQVKAPKSLAPRSANAVDLSIPREAINRASFRIQSAFRTRWSLASRSPGRTNCAAYASSLNTW